MLRRLAPAVKPGDARGTDPNVRLIVPSRRQPETAIERLATAALGHGGTTSLSALITRVSRDLYREELACGAAILDLGLFGPELFVKDVALELRAANGILWQFDTSACG
jgi:hypothetical protein